nr:MAG TPA: NNMT/PNMT/TEMT family [Caudoviricetes sp.]
MNYDYDKLRAFIKRCKWNWATTMIDVPHEYIVRNKSAITDDEFQYFVEAQREYGVHERWGKYNLQYMYIDGYKYWTMGWPPIETTIMNRQKVFNEFDFLEWPIPRIYTNREMDVMTKSILVSFKGKKFFEAGIGNGDFVSCSKIQPELYYGIDPSKKAIKQFRENTVGFYRRCSTNSFEEAVNKWLSADSVIIALFGTASYFMHQYLRKLGESGLDYCLMFYREEYSPDEFKDMHHFKYDRAQLRSMFPNCNIYIHKNYITISSKKIIWQKPTIENELFPV